MANENSKQIHMTGAKREKMCVPNTQLLLVLNLIGCVGDASFLNQSQSVAKQNQSFNWNSTALLLYFLCESITENIPLLFQGIILGSWIFAFIYNMPYFLVKNVKSNVCKSMWPEEWMKKAYFGWLVWIVLTFALMVGLYSRVVYTLWFKQDNDNQLSHQQRVSVNKRIVSWC